MTTANRAWRKAIKGAKGGGGNKYKSKKKVVDGITFHSIKEADRYSALKLLERAGTIHGLKLQVRYDFHINGNYIGFYKADFCYWDKTKPDYVVEDCKGMRTQLYKFKKKIMKAMHGIEIFET